MRVALKDLKGVESVDVSLSKGTAVVTFTPGNTVRYEQLMQAIAKNGFVLKGSKIVAEGTIAGTAAQAQLTVSGSGDQFQVQPSDANAVGTALRTAMGKSVEASGTIPEVVKGGKADVLKLDSVKAK